MSNYIPDLARSTLELANQAIAVGKQVKDSVLEYRRKLVAIRNELAEIKQTLKLADEVVSEPLDTTVLHEPLQAPSLPTVNELDTTWPELPALQGIALPEVDSVATRFSDVTVPGGPRKALPIQQRLRARNWPELSPLVTPALPVIELLPDYSHAFEPLDRPFQHELPTVTQLVASEVLHTPLTRPEHAGAYRPQQPIDELPSPLDDSDYWTGRAEALGLLTNEQVDRALDFAQMQVVYDHVAYTVIDAMERGRGLFTGAMVRSILSNQRANIYGSDDVPEFSGIDEVTSTIINNFYVQMSNGQADYPPSAPRVEEAFWNWFNDQGFTDFLEYLALAEDDLPEEDME